VLSNVTDQIGFPVVSAIAMLSLMFETRQADKLTKFGYVVFVLTACSLIVGIAAQIYTIREERRKESDARLKHVEQREHLGRIESEVRSSTRPLSGNRFRSTTISPLNR
jgi:hypothetical protein